MRQEGIHFNDTLTGRVVSFYVKYAKEHKEDFPALETARDNLLRAAHWAWENEDWEAVHDLWEALDTWLDATGDWNNLNNLQERAIDANRKLQNREIELAKVLTSRSTYFELMGQIPAALSDAQEILALGNKVGDPKTIVNGWINIASIYQDDSRKRDEGHSYLELAWDICRDIPDWEGVADVAYRLGHSCWSRGDTDKAREWFQKCGKIAKGLKSSHLEALRYEAYAVTALGNLLREQGDYDEARQYLERSRKLKEKVHNLYSIAFTISSQAHLETAQRNYPKAIELHNEALKIYQEIGAAPAVLIKLRDIGYVYYREGSYDEAISLYEQSRDVGQKVELPTELARTVLWLGRAYEQQQQYNKAWEAYQQALQLVDAEQEPQVYGMMLQDIGDVYQAQGQLEQALDYYQRAAEIKERGDDVSDLVGALQAMADVQVALRRTAEAQQGYERCLALLRGLPAPGEPLLLARIHLQRGRLHNQQERYEEALEAYQQTLQLLDAEQEPQVYGVVLHDIGDVYLAQGRLEQALEYYQRAAEAKERGNDLSGLVTTLRALADVQVELGQTAEALQILEKGVHLLRGSPALGEPKQLARIHLGRGRVYEQQRRYEEALEAYQQALQLLDAEQEPQIYGVVLQDIGDVYEAQGQLEQALEYYQRAAGAKERGNDLSGLVTTLQALAEVQVELGQESEALQVYEKCLAFLRGLPAPGESKQLAGVIVSMGEIHLAQTHPEIALPYFEEAHTLVAGNGISTPQEVRMILTLLATTYRALGREEDAIRTQAAAQALLPMGQVMELASLAPVYYKRGRVYEQQERYKEALETYQQTLQLLDAEQKPQVYGIVLQDIGDVYRAQGQLEQALDYYQRAAEIKERGDDVSGLVDVLQAMADVQVALERPAEAQQGYERCLALLRGLPAPGEPLLLARIHLRRGRVYEQQKRYEEALETYRQALQLLDAEQEPQVYGIVLHDMADVYEAQGRLEQALEYYQRAAQAKERGNDLSDLVTTLQALAEVQVALGQEAEALQVYEKCLALSQALPASSEPDQNELRASVLMQTARCQEALNSWGKAKETYEHLERFLFEEFEHQPNPTTLRRLAWTKYKMGMFEEAAELSHQVDAPETDIDRARARLIAAAVAYILGNRAEAEDHIHHVSANGMLTPDLKWEAEHDIRYVIKYHVPEADLEQFMALVAAT